jgi:hypothetical protein
MSRLVHGLEEHKLQTTFATLRRRAFTLVGSDRSAHDIAVAGLRFAFLVWLCMRVVFSAWGAMALVTANPQSFENAYATHPDIEPPQRDLYGLTIGVWNIYDTRHYVQIVEQGYQSDPSWLPAYFPGFPMLIAVVRPLTGGDSLLAGWLIANVSAIIFFWFLYRLVAPDYGTAAARRAVVFSAVFPASFFLFLGYVEAMFLACTVAAFYYAGLKKWWLAGVLGGVATLTKQPGVFLMLPLAYMYLRQFDLRRAPREILKRIDWLPLLLIPLSAMAYMLYRYIYVEAPILGATDLGGQQALQLPGAPLLSALTLVRADNPMLGYNLLDIAFTLVMVVLSIGVLLKVRSVPLQIYTATLLLANLSLTMYTYVWRPEVNMPRRALLIFPMFIFLALITGSPRRFHYLAAISGAVGLFLCGAFVTWAFVS